MNTPSIMALALLTLLQQPLGDSRPSPSVVRQNQTSFHSQGAAERARSARDEGVRLNEHHPNVLPRYGPTRQADGSLHHDPVRLSNTPFQAWPTTTLVGVLEAAVIDDFAQHSSEMHYYLRSDDGNGQRIHFPAATRLKPGARFTVTGQARGEELLAYAYEEMLPSVSTLPDPVIGEQTTLVLLFNFLDDLSEPNTVAEVDDLVFNDSNPESVNSRLLENSFTRAWLAGDVLSWQTLPINSEKCGAYLRPFSSIFQNTVDFVDEQVDFSLYRRIIVLKPLADCPFGPSGSFGDITMETDEGQFKVSVAFSALGEFFSPRRTVFHELGHNFELVHPDDLECGEVVVGDYADGCDTIDRGDGYDLMANIFQGHINASSKYGSPPN